jgi:hypothetical protein
MRTLITDRILWSVIDLASYPAAPHIQRILPNIDWTVVLEINLNWLFNVTDETG